MPDCAGSDIQADGSASIGNNLIYEWSVTSNWGVNIDNNISSNPIISFPDNQSGTDSIYNIQVLVISDMGCRDSINQDVTIYTRPVALFDIDSSICGPNTISPINNSSFATNYTWSVDQNGTITTLATQPNPTFLKLTTTP